jgi:hypothetical protein
MSQEFLRRLRDEFIELNEAVHSMRGNPRVTWQQEALEYAATLAILNALIDQTSTSPVLDALLKRLAENDEELKRLRGDCARLVLANAEVAALNAELQEKLTSAECVVRQVARDTYGEDMTVKQFADHAGYDS